MRAAALIVFVAGSALAAPIGSGGSGSGSGAPIIIQIPTDASAPVVSASASPSVAVLGAKLTLFITATFDAGVEVNLREPVEVGGAFEVRRKISVADRLEPDGKHVREWQLEVTPWDVGELQIPPIAVTFTAGGRASQVATNAVPIKVTGMLGDTDDPKQLRDLAPPNRLTHRDWFWLWVGGAAAAGIGALVALLWYRARRRKRTTKLVGRMIAVPRHMDNASERALERLLAIEQSGVLDRDADRKRGYGELVEVVRGYLGTRYRVATLDLTTRELMRGLANVAPAEELAMIEGWLASCDLVKYGGLATTASIGHRALDDARAVIVATTVRKAAA